MDKNDILNKAYDEFADTIICSEDYKNCMQRTEGNECIEYYHKHTEWKKCWHISKCPKGYNRR